MKILDNVTITLTEEDVKELVTEKLKKEGYEAKNISINIGTETRGFGRAEHDITVFKNITCTASKIKTDI